MFIFLLLVTVFTQQDCLSKLQELQSNQTAQIPYMLTSGAGPNQLGDVGLCASIYSYATLVYDLPFPYNFAQFGLCYPTQCTLDQMNKYLPSIIKQLPTDNQTIYGDLFPQLHKSINNQLVDPKNKEGKGFSFYFSLIILFLPILLISILTFKKSEIFSFFSLYQNLYIVEKETYTLGVFQAYRIIGLFSVILGLTYYVISLQAPNQKQVEETKNKVNGLFVYFNLYWPDIFLWMSGFLLSKSLIRNSIRRKEMIKEFGLYFIRIYPVYLIGLLVYSELSPHLSGGAKSAGLIRQCKCSFWSYLLLGNFLNDCNPFQIWYVSVLLQLSLMGLGILLVYEGKKKQGKYLIGILFLTFKVVSIIIGLSMGIYNVYELDRSQFQQFFLQPWMCAPVYLIGIFQGINYREYMDEQNSPLLLKLNQGLRQKKYVYLLYVVGLSIIFTMILIQNNIFLLSFNRILVVMGCTLIALNSMGGSIDDPISKNFENMVMSLLSKISYSCFIISLTVIQCIGFNNDQTIYYSEFNVFIYYCTCLPLIILAGILLYLFVELPCLRLKKILRSHNYQEDYRQAFIKLA